MPGYAKRAVDSAFRRLGVDADFSPANGEPVPGVRVIVHQADIGVGGFGLEAVSAGTVVDVRAAEVAEPRNGDSFLIGGAVYTVNAKPKRNDSHRLVWTCPAVEG